MATKFAFSDDAGDYRSRDEFEEGKHRRSRFYVRATLLLDSAEYSRLEGELDAARQQLGITRSDAPEIKWQHLMIARNEIEAGKPIKSSKPYAYLSRASVASIDTFLDRVFDSVGTLVSSKLIVTVSKSGTTAH